jgi:hypothetical protein
MIWPNPRLQPTLAKNMRGQALDKAQRENAGAIVEILLK